MKTNPHGRDLTLQFFLIEAFFWAQYAILLGYTSMYLLDHGFSNTAIGSVIAAAGIASALLQPVMAAYADRPDSISLKLLLYLLAAAVILIGVLLLVQDMTMVTGILYGIGIALVQTMTPLINSLGMKSINQGGKLNFGIARAGGSISYALGSYLIGMLAESRGTVVVPIGCILVYIMLLLLLYIYPFRREEGSVEENRREQNGSTGFFRRYPKFAFLLAGCILVYVSHNLINTFIYQITAVKGGGSGETGTAMAIAATLELIPMVFFGSMLKRLRCDIWLRIAGLFFTVKIAATLLAPDILALFAVQILQPLGWGVMAVASVYYVNGIVDRKDVVKGQAYMTMTFTIGSVLAAMAGGYMIDNFGVSAMLIAGSIASAVGTLIIILGAEPVQEHAEKAGGQTTDTAV